MEVLYIQIGPCHMNQSRPRVTLHGAGFDSYGMARSVFGPLKCSWESEVLTIVKDPKANLILGHPVCYVVSLYRIVLSDDLPSVLHLH